MEKKIALTTDDPKCNTSGSCFHHHGYVFISFLHQQAIHLIEEMDQDGDGQISEAEVLKNQDTFLNSEVTDYGRQLHVSHDEL